MVFPTLYKKTSTGAIQFWEISVIPVCQCDIDSYPKLSRPGSHSDLDNKKTGGSIITKYGQLDTNSPQTTFDLIKEGKNKGKKNETNAYEQAKKEAKSRWEKQKKKGYVDSIEAAEAEEIDDVIEGGIVPMLAHKFVDHGHKLSYPVFYQYKLDGIRMIAIVKDGKATLWSRTRKQITSLPHIIEEIEKNSNGKSFILDGEAYNHAYKENFEKIVSLVRQEEPDPEHTQVEYHIYDLASHPGPFIDRLVNLEDFFKYAKDLKYLKEVESIALVSEQEIADAHIHSREKGYEGIMLRSFNGLYVNKRSYDLLKVKEFLDDEFEIIGIEEGRGKLVGHVGAFICKTNDGKQFLAKSRGSLNNLKHYFENEHTWKGKKLTVRHQGLTKYGIPRFPVGIAIRDYE
jgi:DNA ligase-1